MSPKDIIIRNEPNTKNIAKSYERVNFGTDTKKNWTKTIRMTEKQSRLEKKFIYNNNFVYNGLLSIIQQFDNFKVITANNGLDIKAIKSNIHLIHNGAIQRE